MDWLLSRSRIAVVAALGASLMAPSAASEPVDSPLVVFETSKGVMTVELLPLEAPKTVENILELVDTGFYDGLIFHRVIEGFVAQAGGHLVDMGYKDAPRTVVNESENGVSNRKYTLSMARATHPDSAGAQFYINLNDNPYLDYKPGQPGYTVFGRLVEGTDVADEIGQVETTTRSGMQDVPVEPVIIVRAYRREDGKPDTP